MRILVLGAGFGGLELTTRLSDALGDDVDIVLIDQADGFVFGFSKLDVMFGRTTAEAVRHPYRDLVKPGVRFVRAAIRSIDPVRRRVETDDGAFEADVMVVARHSQSRAVRTYDGKGICYIEFGHDRVARVEVTFRSGEPPNGQFDEPSERLLADKAQFGTSRIRRWFSRDWSGY